MHYQITFFTRFDVLGNYYGHENVMIFFYYNHTIYKNKNKKETLHFLLGFLVFNMFIRLFCEKIFYLIFIVIPSITNQLPQQGNCLLKSDILLNKHHLIFTHHHKSRSKVVKSREGRVQNNGPCRSSNNSPSKVTRSTVNLVKKIINNIH